MGHVLGLEHSHGDDVMGETLPLGVRRVPEVHAHDPVANGQPSAADGDVARRLLDTVSSPAAVAALAGQLSNPMFTLSAGEVLVEPAHDAAVTYVLPRRDVRESVLSAVVGQSLDDAFLDQLALGLLS